MEENLALVRIVVLLAAAVLLPVRSQGTQGDGSCFVLQFCCAWKEKIF